MLAKAKLDMEVYREKVLKGKVLKTMLWLAWPIIVANLVNMSYNLVDAYWLGKLGRDELSAPGVSWPLIMLFYSIGMGLSSAGIALISQYLGANEKELARKSAGHLFFFMIFMAITLSVIGFFLSPYILALMGVPPDVYPYAVKYIKIIFVGIPIAFAGFSVSAMFSAIGDTKTPMILGIVSSVINIVLDPLFIFGYHIDFRYTQFRIPRLGVLGAAIATVISRSILSIVGLVLLAKGFRGLRIKLSDAKIESWWIRKVVEIGTPISIQRAANSMGFVIMMSIVSRFGSIATAAYVIGIRVIDVIQSFTWGIMRASAIMVGQTIGAEMYSRAREIAKKGTIFIASILAIGTAIIVLFRSQLVAFFIPEDPAVIAEGSRMLLLFAPSIPLFGIFFFVGGIAQGSGHVKAYTIISIARLWLFRIGLSILLALIFSIGLVGVWIAMSISNIFAGIVSLAWLSRGAWLKRVIEIPTSRITKTETKVIIDGD